MKRKNKEEVKTDKRLKQEHFLDLVNDDKLDEAKHLLKRGANIDAQNVFRETALHRAVHHNNVRMVKFLLTEGIQVAIRDQFDWTPLDWAKSHGLKQLVSLIENNCYNVKLTRLIANSLLNSSTFNDFLVNKIDDPRLFFIVSDFAVHNK